jgi:hypothetical protein
MMVLAGVLPAASTVLAEDKPMRVGLIGLDTSHVIAFTQVLNDASDKQYVPGCKVVAGYPGGSPDVESSHTRVDKYTNELRDKYGVEIVDSIETLCEKVDFVLLESVDGRPHLEQVKPVFAAGKPLFIDKPLAGSLADAIEIFQLAEKHNVPCFSSSSLRFSSGILGMRNNDKVGKVLGCDAWSPCSLEPHHPDLFWYGVHGVEILFTIMGPGCETVARAHTDGIDVVTGIWTGGRIGTYRGIRDGQSGYGATVFGEKSIAPAGSYEGYVPLVREIVKFFKSGKSPVDPKETIEMFAFMTAADLSKQRGGTPVKITEVMAAAEKQIASRK